MQHYGAVFPSGKRNVVLFKQVKRITYSFSCCFKNCFVDVLFHINIIQLGDQLKDLLQALQRSSLLLQAIHLKYLKRHYLQRLVDLLLITETPKNKQMEFEIRKQGQIDQAKQFCSLTYL